MASEHVHEWILVTNFGDTRLMRFCQSCPERQMLSPDDWHKELEQQLAQARADVERLRAINDDLGKENDDIGQANTQARALLERVADFDSYDDYSIQPLQEEIRAFLAQHTEP